MNYRKQKTHEAAKGYLRSSARFIAWDNHEDMDEANAWNHTFSFLTNGEDVVEYIKNNLTEGDIQEVRNEIEDEGGEPFESDEFDERFGLGN